MNKMTEIENNIKELIKEYKINIIYENNTEIFETTYDFTINTIINKIDNIYNKINKPSIDDIKNNMLTDKITSLEANIDYTNKNKQIELKNISVIEKTKQMEIEKIIKLEEEKTKQLEIEGKTKIKLEDDRTKIKLEEEKTKQLEIENKTKQLELQIELFKLTGKII
jgi:hypothetical protein